MQRQLGLFRGVEMSEDQMEAAIEPIYPHLWQMIWGPFSDLLRRRSEDAAFRIMDEGETAQWLRPQIVATARVLFEGNPDVQVEKRRSQLRIKYRNQLAITPKKFRRKWMDRGLTFSSFETPQNKNYWRQRAVEGIDGLPRIIIGYRFIAEMTDIQVLIAYPHGKQLALCYPMPEQQPTTLNVISDRITVEMPEKDTRGFVVVPRQEQERGAS